MTPSSAVYWKALFDQERIRAERLQQTVDWYADVNDCLILAEDRLDALIDELEEECARPERVRDFAAIIAKYKAEE